MTMHDNSSGQFDLSWSRRTCFKQSWLSMKTWVQIWLWFLNAVFLAAFFFRDHPETGWILKGYAATVPFLLVQGLMQRGLTRSLGLGHLIPWIPLFFYMVARLAGVSEEILGAKLSYEQDPIFYAYFWLLTIVLGICLFLDIVDVFRWFKGERYVLGSYKAASNGASKLAPGLR